jgi:DNA polymerase I-like protein with 3'-5' exonuclease and polymerase domains
MKTRMIMNVHDEVVLEIHESEAGILAEVKAIMESVYPYRYLPLTVSASHSFKSLADKVKGYPT